MQQAVFTAHCPYELGDIVEVAIIEGRVKKLEDWQE